MDFSYLDPSENVGIPQPMKNAGLYAGDIPFKKTKYSRDYSTGRIEPDAVAFASQFDPLARSHIPTSIRPGNNSILNNPFTFMPNMNTMCYNA